MKCGRRLLHNSEPVGGGIALGRISGGAHDLQGSHGGGMWLLLMAGGWEWRHWRRE